MKASIGFLLVPLAFLSSIALVGCGGSDDDDQGETPAEAACEHMAESGTAVTAAASAEATSSTSDVTGEHEKFTVTLGSSASNTGYVQYAAAEAGEFFLALNADIPVELTTSAGASVAFESVDTTIEECTEVKSLRLFDLDVGMYKLRLGPTAATTVGLVLEHAGDHAHD